MGSPDETREVRGKPLLHKTAQIHIASRTHTHTHTHTGPVLTTLMFLEAASFPSWEA